MESEQKRVALSILLLLVMQYQTLKRENICSQPFRENLYGRQTK